MNELYPPTADGLMAILRRLRAPDGCPWDRAQTAESLGRCLASECGEFLDALDKGDPAEMCDELGDVLMNALFQALLAEERGQYTLTDVWRNVNAKMVRRHEHVFGEAHASTPEEVLQLWGKIKAKEKGAAPQGLLHSVKHSLSALERAQKLQSKAAEVGFDWPSPAGAAAKVAEEARELEEALASGSDEEIDSELGDLMFAAVNLARMRRRAGAEELMRRANRKFEERFNFVEARLKESGRSWEDTDLKTLDSYWDQAKKAGL